MANYNPNTTLHRLAGNIARLQNEKRKREYQNGFFTKEESMLLQLHYWSAWDALVTGKESIDEYFLPTDFTRIAQRLWAGLLVHLRHFKDDEHNALLVAVELIDRELQRVVDRETNMRPMSLPENSIKLIHHALMVCDQLQTEVTRQDWRHFHDTAFTVVAAKLKKVQAIVTDKKD